MSSSLTIPFHKTESLVDQKFLGSRGGNGEIALGQPCFRGDLERAWSVYAPSRASIIASPRTIFVLVVYADVFVTSCEFKNAYIS